VNEGFCGNRNEYQESTHQEKNLEEYGCLAAIN
jgi:hypothetical protein